MLSLFLMVLGNDLEPDHVTKAFGLRPSQCWRRGERKSFISKIGKTHLFLSKHKCGGWKKYYRSARSEEALIRQIARVAKNLIPCKIKLRALIKSGNEIYLISLVQGTSSIVIPPEIHALLGDLGIHLQIDFWPSAKERDAA